MKRNAYQLVTPVGTFQLPNLAAAIRHAQNLGYKSVVRRPDGTTVVKYHPNLGCTHVR